MLQTKVVEEIKAHILCAIIFLAKILPFWGMLKNILAPYSPRMTTGRMRFACWVPNAANIH